MQQTPFNAANSPTIPDDLWFQYIRAPPTTTQRFRDLRRLREVSHVFCDAVDAQLRDDQWRGSFLASGVHYCHTRLEPDVLHDHSATVRALEEYLEDSTTQEAILQRLHLLFVYQNAAMFYAMPDPATQPQIVLIGMYRAVTQSLRLHHKNLAVVRCACHVLHELPPLTAISVLSLELKEYIFATLARVMHDNAGEIEVQYCCMSSFEKVNGTAALPITVGKYNLVGMVYGALQIAQTEHHKMVCLISLDKFVGAITYSPVDTASMAAVNVPAMEGFLLAFAERARTQAGDVQHCLSTLASLNTLYPERMTQQIRTVLLAKVGLMAFMEVCKLTHAAVRVFISIVPSTWHPTVGVPGTPTAANDIIVLTVSAICRLVYSPESITVCAAAFELLCLLCQNHPGHLACAREHTALELLDERFSPQYVNDTNPYWWQQRNQFEAMLVGGIPV